MKSLLAAAALLVLGPAAYAQEREGMVIDGATDTPIAGAIVTVGQRTVLTDPQGRYRTEGGTLPLQIRAPGYRRETLPAGSGNQDTIRLTPLAPKALYLTVYGIGAPFLLDPEWTQHRAAGGGVGSRIFPRGAQPLPAPPAG